MNDLSDLTIDQLALAVGEERLPLADVLAECRRRQRQLDAAEAMAKALGELLDWSSREYQSNPRIDSESAAALAAYQAAKGDR